MTPLIRVRHPRWLVATADERAIVDRSDARSRPPPRTLGARRPSCGPDAKPRRGDVPDRFFRDMVSSMRNGVIAITRDGQIAVLNEVACEALDLHVRPSPHRRSAMAKC